MKSNAGRLLAISVVLISITAAGFWIMRQPQPAATYWQFLSHVQAGEVKKATVTVGAGSGTDQIAYTLANGSTIETVIPSDRREAMAAMQAKAVDIEIRDGSTTPTRLLTNSIPFLLLLGVWVFMMSRGMRLQLRRS
jgi:ATP-dependent Zn protease